MKRTEGKNPVAAFANLCCALHPFSSKKDSGPAGRVVSSNQVKNEFTNVETSLQCLHTFRYYIQKRNLIRPLYLAHGNLNKLFKISL